MSEPLGEATARAEAAWITCAGEAMAAGDRLAAARKWAEALRIARLELPPGHPFLLPSLAQHALRLVEREPALATNLLDEAIACARGLARDVAGLPARPTARSSTFHLRLEAKHRGAYAAARHRLLRERLDRAVGLLERLRDGERSAFEAAAEAGITGGVETVDLALACLPRPVAS